MRYNSRKAARLYMIACDFETGDVQYNFPSNKAAKKFARANTASEFEPLYLYRRPMLNAAQRRDGERHCKHLRAHDIPF